MRGNPYPTINVGIFIIERIREQACTNSLTCGTGSMPLEHLQQTRFGTARELLPDSNLSIAGISYRVGYGNPSYFSALFKKLVSLTPAPSDAGCAPNRSA